MKEPPFGQQPTVYYKPIYGLEPKERQLLLDGDLVMRVKNYGGGEVYLNSVQLVWWYLPGVPTASDGAYWGIQL
jgi:hypothetical protein